MWSGKRPLRYHYKTSSHALRADNVCHHAGERAALFPSRTGAVKMVKDPVAAAGTHTRASCAWCGAFLRHVRGTWPSALCACAAQHTQHARHANAVNMHHIHTPPIDCAADDATGAWTPAADLQGPASDRHEFIQVSIRSRQCLTRKGGAHAYESDLHMQLCPSGHDLSASQMTRSSGPTAEWESLASVEVAATVCGS